MSLKTVVLESFSCITINEHLYRTSNAKRYLLGSILCLRYSKRILPILQKNALKHKAFTLKVASVAFKLLLQI